MKYDLEKVIVVEHNDETQADLDKLLTSLKKKDANAKSKTFSNLELNRLKNQPKAKPKAKPKSDPVPDVIERAHGYRFKEELDNGDRIYYDPERKRQIYLPFQDLERGLQLAKEKLGLAAKYRQEAEMQRYNIQRWHNQQVKLNPNRDLLRKTYS